MFNEGCKIKQKQAISFVFLDEGYLPDPEAKKKCNHDN